MNDELDVLVVLDRSGSMQSARADHEGGLKSFVSDQRDLDGDVRFTLVQFDSVSPCEIVYDRTPIGQVGDIQLIPRGGTPLLDAIGKATSHLQQAKPANVVCMIITDGEENESREWTKDRIRDRIAELEKAGWTFLFLGANVDAFHEARGLGISLDSALGYQNTAGAVQHAYSAVSHNMGRMRVACAAASAKGGRLTPPQRRLHMNFNSAQRAAAMTPRPLPKGPKPHGPVSGGRDSATDEETEG